MTSAAPESRPLRHRMLLWLLLPQLLVWVLGSQLAWSRTQAYTSERLDQDLEIQLLLLSQGLVTRSASEPLLADLQTLGRALTDAQTGEHLRYAVLSEPDGRLLAGQPIAAPPVPPQPRADGLFFYSVTTGRIEHRIAGRDVTVFADGQNTHLRLLLARDRAPYHDRALRLMHVVLLPVGVLSLLLTLLTWLALRRGLRPLDRLVQAIDGIQEGSLRPVRVPDAPPEIRAVADAVNHLLDSVSRQIDSEKRFVADAAHQLRTPLAGLISQAELARTDTDPRRLQLRIARMHGAAQRSAHLVQQMLALARTEATADTRQAYELGALARQHTRDWVPRALAAGIDLGYEGQDEPVWVAGEQLLMGEALGNLIDNALHYAGPGALVTVRVCVKPASGDAPARALLEVADTGPGVAPDHLDKLFQRFWRANPNEADGCGIGLPLVAKVAARHGGTVHASLAEPHGLVIRLLLPLAEPPAAASA